MKVKSGLILIFAIAVIALMGAAWIQAGRNKSPATLPVHLISGLDATGSFRPYLGGSVLSLTQSVDQLDPSDTLTLYRLDNGLHELYDDAMPESGETLLPLLEERMSKPPTIPGTNAPAFWNEAARRVGGKAASETVVVVLYSDGDCDLTPDVCQQTISAAAGKLAANPHVVAVAVVGVRPSSFLSLQRDLAPLGDRLHIYPPEQADISALLDHLDEARSRSQERKHQ